MLAVSGTTCLLAWWEVDLNNDVEPFIIQCIVLLRCYEQKILFRCSSLLVLALHHDALGILNGSNFEVPTRYMENS